MKRSGFKQKSYTELLAQEKARRASIKKEKLPSIKTLRNRADKKLTPLVKKIYPKCLLCPHMTPARSNETEVAHHHVHKSKSNSLRYELDNLIPLCHMCHMALHHNESYWATKIVMLRGIDWATALDRKKNQIVKADRYWYMSHIDRLDRLMEMY